MKLINKKTTLVFFFVLLVLVASLFWYQTSCNYSAEGFCWRYWSMIGGLGGAVNICAFSIPSFFYRPPT